MRMLMRVQMDTEASNRVIAEGRLQSIMQSAMERIKPEATYFTALDGQRTAYFFFDMTESAGIPVLAEPLFRQLGARIDFFPAMNVEEMRAGVAEAAKNI